MADFYQAGARYIKQSPAAGTAVINASVVPWHVCYFREQQKSNTERTELKKKQKTPPNNPCHPAAFIEPLGGAAGVQLNSVYSDNYKAQ